MELVAWKPSLRVSGFRLLSRSRITVNCKLIVNYYLFRAHGRGCCEELYILILIHLKICEIELHFNIAEKYVQSVQGYIICYTSCALCSTGFKSGVSLN
jgi:hypothetical protein